MGLRGIAGRPNYIVLGRKEAMLFLTAAKSNGREGRPFCARTKDGGVTWQFVSHIGPEPGGFAIMPATVTLPEGILVTAIRRRERPPQGAQRDWIEAYTSSDHGKTCELSRVVEDTGRVGSPASMLRLPHGRLS